MSKHIKTIFFVIVLSLPNICTAASIVKLDSGEEIKCDQLHEANFLRYDYSYRFYNTWNNESDDYVYLHTWNVYFVNANYLDAGKPFDWSQEFRDSNFSVAPRTSVKKYLITGTKWRVAKKPTKRAAKTLGGYDFMIIYKTTYDKRDRTLVNVFHDSNVSCQPYIVTWIGDGVLDNGYEVCDPADIDNVGWGPNGCDDKTAKPIP